MWLKRLATTAVLTSALVLIGILAEANPEWPIGFSPEQRPRSSSFGNRVYYPNGEVAWNGLFRSCYYPNGRIRQSNCNGITVDLGSSIYLTVTREEAYLYVDGTIYYLSHPNSSLVAPNRSSPSLLRKPLPPLFRK